MMPLIRGEKDWNGVLMQTTVTFNSSYNIAGLSEIQVAIKKQKAINFLEKQYKP